MSFEDIQTGSVIRYFGLARPPAAKPRAARAGLFDEYNTDIVGQSFYLEPDPPIGRFSKAFFLPLLREFTSRRKSLERVSRTR